MKYAVETLFTYGWENCWLDANESLTFFDTREDAERAIKEHISDCIDAVEEGFLEDSPDPSEFRVVEVA